MEEVVDTAADEAADEVVSSKLLFPTPVPSADGTNKAVIRRFRLF
jgi:hypothetical protein